MDAFEIGSTTGDSVQPTHARKEYCYEIKVSQLLRKLI